jgi:branched-subunit amino acid transport protein
MNIWLVVIVLGVVTVLIKAAGPVVLGNWKPPARTSRVFALVTPVVLAALVATEVLTSGQRFQFDMRLVGLGAAAIALLFRAPLLVVVLCAVVSTAVGRLLFG